MRWTRDTPTVGDGRVRKVFTWLPTLCSNGVVVWLEFIHIHEEYQNKVRRVSGGHCLRPGWRNTRTEPWQLEGPEGL